ncbi:MAG: protein kinase [Chloroflexota bacterium]
MTLTIGSLLNGRYKILEILGQGGMGSVYRAMDENLTVSVAVKENLFTTDDYSRQFRLEASILANVRNEHLPRVTDYFILGEDGQYLVMDFINGEDLRQRMEREGKIKDSDAVLIGAAVCEALTYLHSRSPSVLHRDIKPGNIKITPEGEIYLVDFGLAKLVHGSQTTTTGARAMTPGYSPPEQYGTARTDPRSDIYSLGATLYASLTGVIPEDGLARVMDNIKLTPIRKNNPGVPQRLAFIIEKAMEAYPDNRYQSAEEFRQELLLSSSKTIHFIERSNNISIQPPPKISEPVASDPALPIEKNTNNSKIKKNIKLSSLWFRYQFSRIPNQYYLFAFILVLLSGLLILNKQVRSSSLAIYHTNTPLVKTTTEKNATQQPSGKQKNPPVDPTQTLLTQNPSITSPTPSVTPQGGGPGEIGFVSDRTGIPQIYLMNVLSLDLKQLTNEQDGACQPDFSPDGTKLVFISPCRSKQDIYKGSSLFVLDLNSNIKTTLPLSLGGDFEPAWSPDNNHIAFTSLREGQMDIYMINLSDNHITRLTNARDNSGGTFARQPNWNPFGSQIAYTLKRQGLTQIWVTTDGDANLTKPNKQLVQSGNLFLDSMPAWSPDGQYIVFNQTNFSGTAPFQLMSILYEKRETMQAAPVNIEPLPVVNVAFSPDGQWLVFESWPDSTHNQDIFLATILGKDRKRLTTDPGNDFDPVWRPGSKHVILQP